MAVLGTMVTSLGSSSSGVKGSLVSGEEGASESVLEWFLASVLSLLSLLSMFIVLVLEMVEMGEVVLLLGGLLMCMML